MSSTQISTMTLLSSLLSSGSYVPVVNSGDSTNYRFDLATELAARINQVATRTAMATVAGSAGLTRYLTESGREGLFVWSSANNAANVTADPQQGIYVAPSTDTTGASGAWMRKYDGPINAAWFGTGSAAMSAAQTLVGSMARSGYGYNKGVPQIRVPFSLVNFTAAFDVTWPIHWIAEGNGGATNAATVLAWDNTSSGLRIQFVDTTGDSGTQAADTHSGSGAIFEGFHLDGGFSNGVEAERHAVHARAKVQLRDCSFFNWAGDAIHVDASTVGAHKGNANIVKAEDCWAENCRNGWACDGNDDTNAGTVIGFSANICRRWGILESSFLGNQVLGGHFDSNARTSWNTGAANHPCSYVGIGGWQYFVIEGQAAGASTNAPKSSIVTITIAAPGVVSWAAHALPNGTQVAFSTTGALPTGLSASTAYYVVNAGVNDFQVSLTAGGAAINTSGSQSGVHTSGAGIDNTWWGSWQAGAVAASTGIPLWTNGIVVRSGGPILITGINNATTVFGPHIESNGVNQIDQLASWHGGNSAVADVVKVSSGALARDRANRISANAEGLNLGGITVVRGELQARFPTNILGPHTGATIQDGGTTLASRSSTHTLSFTVYTAAGAPGTATATIAATSAAGLVQNLPNAAHAYYWEIASSILLTLDTTGLVGAGKIASTSPTAGIGYAMGAGGTITQITSRTTGVTINNVCGAITLVSAAGTATWQSFTVTNSRVAATDNIKVDQKSGTDLNMIHVTNVAAGSFQISFATTGGVTVEQPVFNFAVLKAVAA